MTKILVVDDEPDIVYIVERLLRKHGFDVASAYGGKEALEKVKQEKPDLILLDIMMPDLDGWEVAKKLREDPETRAIPIVILSVKGEEEDMERSFQYSRVNAHVTKPIVEDKLISTINWVLKMTAKRREAI